MIQTDLQDSHGTVIHIQEIDVEDSCDLLHRSEIESYCDWFTVIGDIRSGLFDKRIGFHRAITRGEPVLNESRLDEADLRPIEILLCVNGVPGGFCFCQWST